jgi:hypothetical protein
VLAAAQRWHREVVDEGKGSRSVTGRSRRGTRSLHFPEGAHQPVSDPGLLRLQWLGLVAEEVAGLAAEDLAEGGQGGHHDWVAEQEQQSKLA